MGLIEEIDRNVELTWWEGDIPVNYVYTYGLGLEKFFRNLKDNGKFLASRCESCGFVYLPCRTFCERCLEPIEKTFTVSGRGEIYAYTVCHENHDGSPKKKPQVAALIKVEGTDSVMAHYIGGVKDPGEVRVGMAVAPVLVPKKERKGGILDISHFKPARR